MIAEPISAEQAGVAVTQPLPSFIVSQSILQKALKQIGPFVASNDPIVPILANVMLAVSDDELRLTGSNLRDRMSIDLSIERGISAAYFHTTVDYKRLYKLVSSLPEQPLTLNYDDENGRLIILAYSAEYTLSTDKAIDYPKLPAFPPAWSGPGEPEKAYHDVISVSTPRLCCGRC